MSKVIIKMGQDSTRVNKEDIIEYVIDGRPQVKVKLAKDESVLFYDRNPFYAIITDFTTYPELNDAIRHLKNDNVSEAASIINGVLIKHVSSTFNDEFSTSVIYALKNSKTVALRSQK